MNTIVATQLGQSIASQKEDLNTTSSIPTNSLLQLQRTFQRDLHAFIGQLTLQTAAPLDSILEVVEDALEEINRNELLTMEDIEIQPSDELSRWSCATYTYRRELLKDNMGMLFAELSRGDDYSDCSDEESDGEDEWF